MSNAQICIYKDQRQYTLRKAIIIVALAGYQMYIPVAVPGMALMKATTIGSDLTITPSSTCTHTSGLLSPSIKV